MANPAKPKPNPEADQDDQRVGTGTADNAQGEESQDQGDGDGEEAEANEGDQGDQTQDDDSGQSGDDGDSEAADEDAGDEDQGDGGEEDEDPELETVAKKFSDKDGNIDVRKLAKSYRELERNQGIIGQLGGIEKVRTLLADLDAMDKLAKTHPGLGKALKKAVIAHNEGKLYVEDEDAGGEEKPRKISAKENLEGVDEQAVRKKCRQLREKGEHEEAQAVYGRWLKDNDPDVKKARENNRRMEQERASQMQAEGQRVWDDHVARKGKPSAEIEREMVSIAQKGYRGNIDEVRTMAEAVVRGKAGTAKPKPKVTGGIKPPAPAWNRKPAQKAGSNGKLVDGIWDENDMKVFEQRKKSNGI
jgi:hypothetical protein